MRAVRLFAIVGGFLGIVALEAMPVEAKSPGRKAAHAVLVTYENDAPAGQMREHPDNVAFARALKRVPGFVSKTWINDGRTFGGFYVFTDRTSAESFINGDLFQNGVVKDPSNRNLQIRHFAVFSKLTALSGGFRTR